MQFPAYIHRRLSSALTSSPLSVTEHTWSAGKLTDSSSIKSQQLVTSAKSRTVTMSIVGPVTFLGCGQQRYLFEPTCTADFSYTNFRFNVDTRKVGYTRPSAPAEWTHCNTSYVDKLDTDSWLYHSIYTSHQRC